MHSQSEGPAPERNPHGSIHELLVRAARATPRAAAIAAPGREALSYERLHSRASDVVQRLNQLGIGRADRVAMVLPNGPEMAVAFVAVAAGATCAPLNPAFRASDFEFYLSDLGAKALIVAANLDSPVRSVAASKGIPVIELHPTGTEAGMFALEGEAFGEPARTGLSGPGEVALVLHTSGTTSRPEQVPLTHANLCASACNIGSTVALTPSDRCLNVMPLFHIHGLTGAVLSSLSSGASVVCTPEFDASRFFGWLADENPSWFTAVPTMHQAIVREARSSTGCDFREIIRACRLRFLRSSSAPLPPSLMSDLEELFDVPVVESYGMTEASHQITSNLLPPGERKPGSVGVPAGPEVAIMDDTGHSLGCEVEGEIVIRGANVTAGHAGDAEARGGFSPEGWFRTGDRGRMDADGYLFVTGRLKEMINRGGETIAPREVDELLEAHPDVVEAAAFAVPHPTLGEDVAAAVVVNADADITEQALREYSFEHLADFKVPSRLLFVDDIPKGPTGKLQRIGLYETLKERLQRPREEPQSELESLVTQYFKAVLPREEVGVTDNFFALGGDSLLATQVLSRVRSDFQIELPLVMVFLKPTPRELAAEIDRLKREESSPSLDRILDDLERLTDEEARRFPEGE